MRRQGLPGFWKDYPDVAPVVGEEIPVDSDPPAAPTDRLAYPVSPALREVADVHLLEQHSDGPRVVGIRRLSDESKHYFVCGSWFNPPAAQREFDVGLPAGSASNDNPVRDVGVRDAVLAENGHARNRNGWLALGVLAMALGIAIAALAPAIAQGRALAACVLGLAGVGLFVKSGVLE